MSLGHYLVLFSSVIWLLPLFKQRGTPYFFYFLSLALADPLTRGIISIVKINPSILVLFILAFQISYLQRGKDFLKYFATYSLVTFALVLLFNSKNEANLLITFYFMILIIIVVLKLTMDVQKNQINLFLVILLFYNVLNLLKFIALVLNFKQGYVSFMIGYTFQILCGIAFAFINIDTKNFKLQIKS